MSAADDLFQTTFPVGPFQCNCTILGDRSTGRAVVVDPGDEPEKVVAALRDHGLEPTHLVHTHAHIDHVGGTRAVCEQAGGVTALHPGDQPLYDGLRAQQDLFPGVRLLHTELRDPLPVELSLEDGVEIPVGDAAVLTCVHTPGHTPGSVCFRVRATGADDDAFLLAGDTLFLGGVGRTDLPGGDGTALVESIRSRLYVLPEDLPVVPGHGPETTIGRERTGNPFVRA